MKNNKKKKEIILEIDQNQLNSNSAFKLENLKNNFRCCLDFVNMYIDFMKMSMNGSLQQSAYEMFNDIKQSIADGYGIINAIDNTETFIFILQECVTAGFGGEMSFLASLIGDRNTIDIDSEISTQKEKIART